MMNITHYLARIGIHKKPAISKQVLFDLQEAHLRNIPFENLDIHYYKKIILDVDTFYHKIVMNKRGGFCYELNGLFYQLLKHIGFNVKMVSGRVYLDKVSYGNEFDHLAIVATIENQNYLVDVGFGKFSLKPLEIQMEDEIADTFGNFKFEGYDSDYIRINEVQNDDLIPQYMFKMQERDLLEFEGMCNYHQQNSSSHFTQKKMISIPTKDGRITLTNKQLKITGGGTEKKISFDEGQFELYLQKYFKIKL